MKSDTVLMINGRSVPVTVRRYRQSKGYRLRYHAAKGTLALSIPMRGAAKKALDWAQSQHIWIERQLVSAPVMMRPENGGELPLYGQPHIICWDQSYPRTPEVVGNELRVGGPEEQVSTRIGRWLRRHALVVLTKETQQIAAKEQILVSAVRVADPRSRWGSCASDGVIRYSWRLILTPPEVRLATVAHEVAHRLHMDHSAAFHIAHRRLLGFDPAPARAWLRANGASLHHIDI